MTRLQGVAHAKLNLTLDVLGTRPDGYHNLKMVMQEIELGDSLSLTLETGNAWTVTGNSGEIPLDESNLAIKAAKLFFAASGISCEGLSLHLDKVTPVCAGMGGGSADGAAILRMLQTHYGAPLSEETLFSLAEQTGADVPFALFGGTALAEEKGQVLTRLPTVPRCSIVLCKPPFPVSTPELFRAIDREPIGQRPNTDAMICALENQDLPGIAAQLCNVFEPVVTRMHPELKGIRQTLLDCGALGAGMTGSGPTMFGLFSQESQARNAEAALKSRYRDTFLTRPV